jgi:hypothetical protein
VAVMVEIKEAQIRTTSTKILLKSVHKPLKSHVSSHYLTTIVNHKCKKESIA